MAQVVIIARMPDGLILAELQDGTGGAVSQNRHKISRLLHRAGCLSPRCSIDCGGGFVFHLAQGDGVCYLAMFHQKYPRNYAFAFLEDIQNLFQEELKREFGTGSVDHRSHVDTIEKPYYFVRLDRHIARKQAEYRDPSSSRPLSRLHANLTQVSGIMQHNIDELLNRGDNLEDVSRKAKQLSTTSKGFSGTARRLEMHALAGRLGTLFVLVLLVMALYIIQRHVMDSFLVVGLVLISGTSLLALRNQHRRTSKTSTPVSLPFLEEYLTDSVF